VGRTAVAKTRTDDLIAVLIAHLKPADSARVSRSPIIASLIGALAAYAAMLLVLGPPPQISEAQNLGVLSIKAFTVGTIVAVPAYLRRFSRPAQNDAGFLRSCGFPSL
jgi:hypothetical protein